jgi:hypothetical protein
LGSPPPARVSVLLGRTRFGARLARLRRRSRHRRAVSASMRGGCSPRPSCSPGCCAGLSGWIVAAYYGNVSFSMGAMLG